MMTEEVLIKELEIVTEQLNSWWKSSTREHDLPKKLNNKVNFLKAYLGAIRRLKDDAVVADAVSQLRYNGIYKPKF